MLFSSLINMRSFFSVAPICNTVHSGFTELSANCCSVLAIQSQPLNRQYRYVNFSLTEKRIASRSAIFTANTRP